MKFFKILFLVAAFGGIANGADVEGILAERQQEIEKGMQQMRDLLRQAPELPPEEAVFRLGLAVYKTSHNRIYNVPERAELHDRLEQSLIAIPGYAEYYRNRINGGQEKLVEAIRLSQDTGVDQVKNLRSVVATEQMQLLQELQEIRDPDTIRVIGEMLFDDRGAIVMNADRSNLEEFLTQRPLAQQARRSLEYMVEDRPTDSNIYPADLRPWRNWYVQIKEGKGKFRFKGDSQYYHLQGAASESISSSAQRAIKRPSYQNNPIGEGAERELPLSNFPVIVVLVVAFLIVGGYWIYRRRQKT